MPQILWKKGASDSGKPQLRVAPQPVRELGLACLEESFCRIAVKDRQVVALVLPELPWGAETEHPLGEHVTTFDTSAIRNNREAASAVAAELERIRGERGDPGLMAIQLTKDAHGLLSREFAIYKPGS